MAKTVVALEATINASGAEGSVKSLKAQLKEAQADVQALSDKFGATSDQAIKAAKKAADLKDRIGDAKALTDAFNPDSKFKAFGAAIQGVAGGFAALQGAQALFGSQSEDLAKSLAKVQGALALSQGIDSVLEAKDSFVRLGGVIKSNVVGAFNGLKAAIGSTGIGLLVIAIPILIANFEKIKQVVANLFPGLAKLGGFIMDLIQNITDFVGITSEAQRATDKLIASNKKQIEETDNFLKYNADKYDEYTIRKIKANNEFKKSQNEILDKYKDDPKVQQKLIKEAREFANREIERAESDRATKAKEARDKQADERKKERDEKAKEREQEAKEILAADQQLQQQRRTISQQEALNNIKDEDERAKKKLEFDYLNSKKEVENSKASTAEKNATIQALYIQYIDSLNKVDQDRNAKRVKEANDALFKLQQAEEQWLLDQANKSLQAANNEKLSFQEREAALKEREDSITSITFKSEEERTAFLKATADARIQLTKAEKDAKIQAATETANTLENLSTLIGKQTAIGKAAAVASTTITTYNAAMQAYQRGVEIPFVGMVLGPVNAALAVAAGIANVKKILSVQVPGGGSGGSAPSGINFPSAPVTPQLATTTLNQGQVNQMANATARAFVLESDVTGNQERIQRLNRAARIN